jgi:hypothetical protein
MTGKLGLENDLTYLTCNSGRLHAGPASCGPTPTMRITIRSGAAQAVTLATWLPPIGG